MTMSWKHLTVSLGTYALQKAIMKQPLTPISFPDRSWAITLYIVFSYHSELSLLHAHHTIIVECTVIDLESPYLLHRHLNRLGRFVGIREYNATLLKKNYNKKLVEYYDLMRQP